MTFYSSALKLFKQAISPDVSVQDTGLLPTPGDIWFDQTENILKSCTGSNPYTYAGVGDYLGSLPPVTSGSLSLGVLTIPPRDFLWIIIRITGYGGGGDIASLRFNGDSGNNYWSRHLTAAPGGPTFADAPTTSTNLIRIAEANSSLQRNVHVTVNNLATKSKVCTIRNTTSTNSAATVGTLGIGGGEWVNTASQITTVEVLTAGANNMGTGSAFAVFGRNF